MSSFYVTNFISRFRKIAPWFAGHPGMLCLAVIAVVVASMTEPAIPALLKSLLDGGFQHGTIAIWKVPVFIVSLFAIRGLAGFLANYCLSYITNSALLKIRSSLFNKLLFSDFSLFTKNSASGLTGTIVYEVGNGASTLIASILAFSKDTLTLLALMFYLFYLNWQLTLIVLAVIPPIAWVLKITTKRLEHLTKSSQDAAVELAYVIEENVLGSRMIRLHNAQMSQRSRFEKLNKLLRNLSLKSVVATSAITPLTQIFSAIALSIVISIALFQSAGNNGVSVGEFVSFITAMLMMIAPIKRISELSGTVTKGLVTIERALTILNEHVDERGGNHCPEIIKGELSLVDVSLIYSNGRVALSGINLTIKAGQSIALVGASGAGKTSLINLLPRFIHPTQGSVFLDGIPIHDWSLECLRRQFAFVSQEVIMLNSSVAENVALGAEYNEKRLWIALKAADLADFVKNLPSKELTIVGHNASLFSGGQRQRLAIARAIYKDAPILILDEATSSLDNTSEQAVKGALLTLSRGRTTIVIAHRLSTIEHADLIVVMDNGCIVETGDHSSLLLNRGKYFHLYHQTNSI